MFNPQLPALNDREGATLPDALPFVIDAHVHIFPAKIFKAIWNWFDQHAWSIRYRFASKDVLNYLLERGIGHIVVLQYAHKPGMARELNRYMAGICHEFSTQVTGLATVFPGEAECGSILREAFEMGLKGVKLHAHVQCFDLNSEEMDIIYDVCAAEGKPLLMHASREPESASYACDPYELCSAAKLENVLRNFPRLNICVPHLGVDEFIPYKNLIEKYDNLWLDTAMSLTDYFPFENPVKLHEMRAERIMYGSDFPNIPYAWDREIKLFAKMGLSDTSQELILFRNAMQFFNIEKEG